LFFAFIKILRSNLFRRSIIRHYENYYKDKYIATASVDNFTFVISLESIINYAALKKIELKDISVILDKKTRFNKTIIKLYSRHIHIVEDSKFFFLLSFGSSVLYRKGVFIEHREMWDVDSNDLFNIKKSNIISFTDDEIEYGNALLSKMGISKEDKIVPMHFRSPFYYQRNRDDSYNNHRNSSFQSLIPSVDYLESMMYKVVLWGHYDSDTENKLRSAAIFSKEERDFFDIFIAYRASFCITGDSGPSILPSLFEVPSINHNVSWYALDNYSRMRQSNIVFLLKECEVGHRLLTFKYLFSKYIYRIHSRASSIGVFKRRYYGEYGKFIEKNETSSESLLKVVQDMTENLNSKMSFFEGSGSYINTADLFEVEIKGRPHNRQQNLFVFKTTADIYE